MAEPLRNTQLAPSTVLVTLKTIRTRLYKLAELMGTNHCATYDPKLFWSQSFPHTELKTLDALRSWTPPDGDESLSITTKHSQSDLFLCQCPGCGMRIEIKYTMMGSRGSTNPDFCVSSSGTACRFSRTSSTKRLPYLSLYRLAEQCVIRRQWLTDVTGVRGYRDSFIHTCMDCGTDHRQVVDNFVQGVSCLNIECPQSLVQFNMANYALITKMNHTGLKNVDWDQWLLNRGYRVVAPVPGRKFDTPFQVMCAQGHTSSQESMMAISKYIKAQQKVHPCPVCRINQRWVDSVLRPLLGVGIHEGQIQNDPSRLASNVADERIIVTCNNGHTSSGTIGNFTTSNIGTDGFWKCLQCRVRVSNDDKVESVRKFLEASGSRLVAYDIPGRIITYQCVRCGADRPMSESSLRRSTFHCSECVRSLPDVLAGMTKGNKAYTLSNGVELMVRGWEGRGLDWLLSNGVQWTDIVYDSLAMKQWHCAHCVDEDRVIRWVPDAMIHSRAQLVEFKDMDRWISHRETFMMKLLAGLAEHPSINTILIVLQVRPGTVVHVGSLARGTRVVTWQTADGQPSSGPIQVNAVPSDVQEHKMEPVDEEIKIVEEPDDAPPALPDRLLKRTDFANWQSGLSRVIQGRQYRTTDVTGVWVAGNCSVLQEGPGHGDYRSCTVDPTRLQFKYFVHGQPRNHQNRKVKGLASAMALAWQVSGWERLDDPVSRPRFYRNQLALKHLAVISHRQLIAEQMVKKREDAGVERSESVKELLQGYSVSGIQGVKRLLEAKGREAVYNVAMELLGPGSSKQAKRKETAIEASALAIEQLALAEEQAMRD